MPRKKEEVLPDSIDIEGVENENTMLQDTTQTEPESIFTPEEQAIFADFEENTTPSENTELSSESEPIVSDLPMLLINPKEEYVSEIDIKEQRWHDIKDAYITRKILSGTFAGVEKLESGAYICIVYYNSYRIVIPSSEMALRISDEGDNLSRIPKILNNMVGAEIDFVIMGIDDNEKSAVASRERAMNRKRQTYYIDHNANDLPHIHEGRTIQARVIAVAQKGIRIEAFGVETTLYIRDLSWDWIGSATDIYTVGDKINILVQKINIEDPENITIKASAKALMPDTTLENLSKCKVQAKYVGVITDIVRGTIYVRLHNGVLAVAHSCNDRRVPGRNDEVSFVVTRINTDLRRVVGIITKIIRQNI